MRVSTIDRCVFLGEGGIVVMQVDDTLGVADDPFRREREN